MFIESLMKPVYEIGKFASWISEPDQGIDNKSGDFEYVKIHDAQTGIYLNYCIKMQFFLILLSFLIFYNSSISHSAQDYNIKPLKIKTFGKYDFDYLEHNLPST